MPENFSGENSTRELGVVRTMTSPLCTTHRLNLMREPGLVLIWNGPLCMKYHPVFQDHRKQICVDNSSLATAWVGTTFWSLFLG